MPLTDTSGLRARREDSHGKAASMRPRFRIRFLTLLIAQLETPAVAWAPLQAESIPPLGVPAAPAARGQPRPPWAAPRSSARTAGSTLWPDRSSARQPRDGDCQPLPSPGGSPAALPTRTPPLSHCHTPR